MIKQIKNGLDCWCCGYTLSSDLLTFIIFIGWVYAGVDTVRFIIRFRIVGVRIGCLCRLCVPTLPKRHNDGDEFGIRIGIPFSVMPTSGTVVIFFDLLSSSAYRLTCCISCRVIEWCTIWLVIERYGYFPIIVIIIIIKNSQRNNMCACMYSCVPHTFFNHLLCTAQLLRLHLKQRQ